MIRFIDNGHNIILEGIIINGRESSAIIYPRAGRYLFSCESLGVRLKDIEAESFEALKKCVLTIIKERLDAMVYDIAANKLLLENALSEIDTNESFSYGNMRMPA